jgi:hypothetical protein
MPVSVNRFKKQKKSKSPPVSPFRAHRRAIPSPRPRSAGRSHRRVARRGARRHRLAHCRARITGSCDEWGRRTHSHRIRPSWSSLEVDRAPWSKLEADPPSSSCPMPTPGPTPSDLRWATLCCRPEEVGCPAHRSVARGEGVRVEVLLLHRDRFSSLDLGTGRWRGAGGGE